LPQGFCFGRYEVRPDERAVLVDGRAAALGGRAFDVLLALVERRGRLVTKEELLHVVWRGATVGESNLHAQVSVLRALLGPQTIATVAGRGYRLAVTLEPQAVQAAVVDVRSSAEAVAADCMQSPSPRTAEQSAVVGDPIRYRFGNCELRPVERALLIGDEQANIGSRAFDVLLALIERRERVVGKNELLELTWPGLVVEESNLPTQVSALRKLIGPQVIQTIPGRGYRFVHPLADEQKQQPSSGSRPTDFVTDPRISGIADDGRARAKFRTNLPHALPSLLGRDRELKELREMLARHRLVSIVGAGGVGKTLLAQHLLQDQGHAHSHGVCWVELSQIRDGSLLCGTIAAALGVHLGSGEPQTSLLAALAPLSVLIALDNADQLVPEVANLANQLHYGAPGASLLVTSQTPLKLPAEHVYRLRGLAVPQQPSNAECALSFGAVALFTERAEAADARFALTDDNTSAVVGVCRALDGLALAIELAAARVSLLGVHQLASSMEDRLSLLTSSPNRVAPARQRTLRAALEWSHGFLDVHERVVFRRLGVMVGSASLELIQQVVADSLGDGELDEWGVLDALGVLVDRSLVLVSNQDDTHPDVPPRYQMLESPRAFALEQLAASGEEPAMRRRHALAVARSFDVAWEEAFSGRFSREGWLRWLSPDLDNARAAMTWAVAAGDAESALTIGATMLRALPMSLHAERMALADRCESLLGADVPERSRQRIWFQLSAQWTNAWKQRSHDAAQRALCLAREIHRRSSDPFLLYRALARLAFAASYVGDADAATAALVELRVLEDPTWTPHRLLWGIEAEAMVAGLQGNLADALRHTRRLAADRVRSIAGPTPLINLINLELAAGDATAAVRTGAELIAALEGTRDEIHLAYARVNVTAAWLALDNPVQARVVAEAGWPQATSFDLQPYWADQLALLAALEGRFRHAARLAGYADAKYRARNEGREANEAAAIERARLSIHVALGAAEYERLHAEGTALGDSDIAAIAFASTAG
jgi:predicted ATPase/DNA-binding winged helix-turn-helix (wHTH) protein